MVNQITLDEIYERGIELPREMFTFPVCEFITERGRNNNDPIKRRQTTVH